MTGGLVVIANLLPSFEAELLKGRLEAEGIFATVMGGYTVPSNRTDSRTRVMVQSEDAERALQIRRDIENGDK